MRLSAVSAGDRVRLDDGFTCMPASVRIVEADEAGNLFVRCREGRHYLAGQINEALELSGVGRP